MTWTDAFAKHNQLFYNQIQQDTWGHLAPSKNKNYKGKIIFACDVYSDDICIININFNDLDDSPWFFDALQEFLWQYTNNNEMRGKVVEWTGIMRNYKFKGEFKTICQFRS